MNSSYLAIILWIGSLLVQFVAYMILSSRQRGRDDEKIAEIGRLEDRVLTLETQMANIKGWLRGSFGKHINGGVE